MIEAERKYTHQRTEHWNQVARRVDPSQSWGQFYRSRLAELYRSFVMPGRRVLEVGCSRGDLLAAVEPSYGLGIDFSDEMIRRARIRHPHLDFMVADAHAFEADETFDIVILSDLINDLWDVQTVFERIRALSHPETRIILNSYSRLWEMPLELTKRLQLANPTLYQNWLTVQDISHLLYLADFEIIRSQSEILFPLDVPVLQQFLNKFLVKLWPFSELALTNFVVARPIQMIRSEESVEPVVSVVVPARNEAGHIEEILDRIPEMGAGTEIVFVEGHSQDDTFAVIEKAVANRPERRCKVFQQTGRGKGDAVRLGFSQADGDVLMILDADMTVPPEDLTRFYDALVEGKGDFINGVRLVYPMEDRAMRFFNLIGNKTFSLIFSRLLGQTIKDTLCGTKVLRADTYRLIAEHRSYFGDFDPFGDFDLIFGAARLNMKIVDLPIRYRERRYGETNIQRWRHGWLLIKMVFVAAFRMKFK
jgi:ubiquinone/menaquinone biosynthesis C-methylase UbiE